MLESQKKWILQILAENMLIFHIFPETLGICDFDYFSLLIMKENDSL